MRRRFHALLILLGAGLLSGCMGLRYIPQAATGQLRLMTGGAKLKKAMADPDTPREVARLLGEVEPVLTFATERGLRPSKSYRRYVALDREYVVWFVTGSDPLAFDPKVYWFPIAGSFAGVGWFKEQRALRHVSRLERQGLDAASRGASAYSTGGWFRDPVVSSMLGSGPAAAGDFANVLLHETLHATVLVNGQTYFNESLASFVADTLTPEYLALRFGAHSVEVSAYRELMQVQLDREARVLAAYNELELLYASALDPWAKLAKKQLVLAKLQSDLELEHRPNNASLLGAKLYGTGKSEFAQLLVACHHDWPRFVAAVSSLRSRHFGVAQLEDFGPVVRNLIAWQCEPLAD